MPTISVVVPTRDRPLFLRQALRSLVAQDFSDFEVIVADNPMTTPSESVVEEFGDDRFRYLRADRPLSMHDNWEAGFAAANGEHVGLMTDRMVWLPSTASCALALLEESAADVISWWYCSFEALDEQSDLTIGHYYPYPHALTGPRSFSGREELAKAMSFSVRRGTEGPAECRGNICFGLYRRDVVDGIRDRLGRVFPPVSPDHTSRVGALLTGTSFVDAGVPLQLSYSSETSNLRQSEKDLDYTRRFLEEVDPGRVDRLPIPGLYASLHNVIAHDFLIAEKLGVAELDRHNLAARAREDLDEVERWPDEAVRREQYRLLRAAERRVGRSMLGIQAGRAMLGARRQAAATRVALRELPYRLLLRMPRLRRSLRRMAGKPPLAPAQEPDTLAGAISAAEADLGGLGTRTHPQR